ncbi:hypothetical protein GOP47_0029833 [Adiantum capillus-veneris]|nr:hypothetical protein GOP47_0029833 [Adiantum capillus-veneris]
MRNRDRPLPKIQNTFAALRPHDVAENVYVLAGSDGAPNYCSNSIYMEISGQDIGGIVADTSNFLDSGLATLGVLTAWVLSTVKGRLDFEIALREATYLSHRTLQLSPAEKLCYYSASFQDSKPDLNDLVVPFALFTTGECHHMDKVLPLWLVNRTGASVVTVMCNRYSDSVHVLDCCPVRTSSSGQLQQQVSNIEHACRCMFIPSTFLDRHNVLWSKDPLRCRPYGDNQALVLCADCVACCCHGLPPINDPTAASSSAAPAVEEYWQSITECLDKLDNQQGALILADADSGLATRHFLRHCALSGDEAARCATMPILDMLHHRTVCDSLSFGSGFAVHHNPFRYGILCIIEAFIQLALVATLHLDAFTAGLVARRMMRAYVGDSTGTGSTLELLFSHIHIGNDAFKVFAAGFAVNRLTIWRCAMIFSVRVASGVLSLALWCYLILANKRNFFFSNAYTKPLAVWVLWYSIAVAVIQATTGCLLFGYSLARVINLPRSFLVLVALNCVVQICYCTLGILKATSTMVRGIGVIPVALEMVVTFHWFVCSLLIGNNPRTPIHGKERLISLWYSLTFLQLSGITSMGGSWK